MREMSLTELSVEELREIDGGAYARDFVDPKTGQVVTIGCTEPVPAGWQPAPAQY